MLYRKDTAKLGCVQLGNWGDYDVRENSFFRSMEEEEIKSKSGDYTD